MRVCLKIVQCDLRTFFNLGLWILTDGVYIYFKSINYVERKNVGRANYGL